MAKLRPGPADTALALVFAVLAVLDIWLNELPGPVEAKVVAAVLTTLPLAWRTIAPVATTAVTTGGLSLGIALGLPPQEASLVAAVSPLLAVYSVGAHASVRGTVVAVALALGQLGAAIAISGWPADEFALYAIGVAIALLVGRAARAMGFEVDVLEARAVELERERDERAKAAVDAERARIARELHDVIGHSISVMGVQAGAVRRLLTPEQEREREALLAVERTGRDAVGEMRRLLGILRANGDAPGHDALPTMRRLDDLVGELRRAGLDVELHVDGELDDLPPGRALAAFRILQEALTNALKHAPGSHVQARLRRTATELEIEVVDSGGTQPADARRRWRPRPGGHARARRAVRRHARGGTRRRRLRGAGALPGDRRLMAVRVLLADDQAMVRTGFRMILELEEDIEVVGEAQDGEEAIAAARRARPDVIVMDVQDAARGRPGGHAAPGGRARPGAARAHGHHLRRGRARIRGAARGGGRLPAQERAAGAARRGRPDGRGRRRAARARGDAAGDRGVRTPLAGARLTARRRRTRRADRARARGAAADGARALERRRSPTSS